MDGSTAARDQGADEPSADAEVSSSDPEAPRLAAVRRLLASAQVSSGLERLSARARRLLRCGNAQVSLLLDGHTVVATAGPAPPGTASDLLPLIGTDAEVLAVADARQDRRLAEVASVASGAVGAFIGVPLLSAEGLVVGALSAYDWRPRRWSQADITLLQELATSTVAELELSALGADYDASRLRWDLAIDAAQIGTFDWDLTTDRVDWDVRLQELFGFAPGEFVPELPSAFSRIHPHDRPPVDRAIEAAINRCTDYRAEFRVILPDGDVRWMSARGRALGDAEGRAVRLLGVCYDVTEIRTARDSAARVLASMAMGFCFLDRTWTVVYVNAEAERVLGLRAYDLVGRNLWEAFPDLADLEFGAQYRHAMETGETVSFESYYPQLDSWFEVRATPDSEGLGVYFLDITERRRAQEEAERSASRLDLLGTVSGELAATLDAEEAVARLARLVVPALGDWCLVTLVNEGRLVDAGSWHVDPAKRSLVEEYGRQRLLSQREGSYVDQAVSSGRPVIVASRATETAEQVMYPGDALDLLRQLAPDSGAVFPLRGRDRTVGLLTLFRGADREPMQTADLTTAQSVAFRAGLALDNARLYRQQRDLAAGLQRTMLTDPPQLADVEIAVRYQPSARAAAVGGDWYDSFVQPTGETVLVIGDVVGHDVEAAAAMGHLRGLLRGIAFSSGAGPAEVLSGLDAAMEGLRMNTTATAVVARLEHPRHDSASGATRMCWSNAGHLPPVLITAAGGVELLDGPEPDLLLGLDPDTARQESDVLLVDGSTVLFYTDGLIERRAQSLDVGIERLRGVLHDLRGESLDDLCDHVLQRLLPEQSEDDVALVAVRLHHRPATDRPGGTLDVDLPL